MALDSESLVDLWSRMAEQTEARSVNPGPRISPACTNCRAYRSPHCVWACTVRHPKSGRPALFLPRPLGEVPR